MTSEIRSPQLAEAVAGLEQLGELPVEEHAERYEAVHQRLTEALSSAAQGAQQQ